ncbi:MAG: class I SAM-dependent methyltransferase, partial [Hymenobacteraceae bacterium]|nr:class I SAM-dependent methyltransferase [Hymenobacteraceae bacterium]MDX5395220.1 class I SAM-dependent methyltransferase [Hymenobacteraceae bacterium]MDX5442191.1 class I SAM-dependent methyltransferase [Hymenobacteraceae bacterium]MDX5511258.1 class I SAM-dependent methyltransferase [Hymenobacteraceae bacterium]
FVIVQCENCTFKFTNPRPDQESIGRYYESEEYVSHSNTTKGIINKAYKIVRSITVKQKVEILNQHTSQKGKILDYGCGTGFFLNACQKDGWEVEGFEPNDTARRQAAELLQKEIEAKDLNRFENESFDAISLWHVLEHIHTLNETFSKIIELAKPGATIIVAVPNADSHDAKQYKENWAAYDVPRHLYHFNQATMKRFLKKHKLQLQETLPMKFDAYYVSMLSEKYKESSIGMFRSMLSGYKSNSYAKNNANDYSSLIYIAKKK